MTVHGYEDGTVPWSLGRPPTPNESVPSWFFKLTELHPSWNWFRQLARPLRSVTRQPTRGSKEVTYWSPVGGCPLNGSPGPRSPGPLLPGPRSPGPRSQVPRSPGRDVPRSGRPMEVPGLAAGKPGQGDGFPTRRVTAAWVTVALLPKC